MKWPDLLVKDIANRKCVIFLGAGISMNAISRIGKRPPSWEGFLREGMNIVDHTTASIIENCISRKDYLMACELLKRELRPDNFNQLLHDCFVADGFAEADIHHDIFNLGSRIVMTPCFDKIYDTYAVSKSRATIAVKNYYDKDLALYLRGDQDFIIKNHGTIDEKNKIIFTQKDYAEARVQNSDFYKIMESLILTHTFLFLGAGVNDPDIRLLFENYSTTYQLSKMHYFTIPETEVTEKERAVLSETMHIDFITYSPDDGYKELKEGINELVSKVDDKRGTKHPSGLI